MVIPQRYYVSKSIRNFAMKLVFFKTSHHNVRFFCIFEEIVFETNINLVKYFLLSILVAFILNGCSDEPTAVNVDKLAVFVTPKQAVVPAGSTFQLKAEYPFDENHPLIWSVTKGPGAVTNQGIYIAPGFLVLSSDTAIVTCFSSTDLTVKDSAIIIITPQSGFDYFPNRKSNYWVYERFVLDSNNINQQATRQVDSLVIQYNPKILGYDAFGLQTYRGNQRINDTSYYAQIGPVIYQYRSPINFPLLQFPRRWMKIADFVGGSWSVFDTTLNNASTSGLPFTISGTIQSNATRTPNEQVTVYGNQYSAQKVVTATIYNITLNQQFLPIPITFNTTSRESIWFVDGIGIVKSEVTSAKIAIPILGSLGIDGNRRNLLRYNVAEE